VSPIISIQQLTKTYATGVHPLKNDRLSLEALQ